MHAHISMTFLKTIVFPYVMEIIPPDNNRSLHLHFLNNTCENSSPDRHVAREWTFFVDVSSLNSLKSTTIKKPDTMLMSCSKSHLPGSFES